MSGQLQEIIIPNIPTLQLKPRQMIYRPLVIVASEFSEFWYSISPRELEIQVYPFRVRPLHQRHRESIPFLLQRRADHLGHTFLRHH